VNNDNQVTPVHKTVLSGGRLDRQHDRRSEPEWIAAQLEENISVHMVWQGHVILNSNAASAIPTTRLDGASAFADWRTNAVFLGELDGSVQWGLDASSMDRELIEGLLHNDDRLVNLRDAAGAVGEDDGNLLAFATGMGYWHRTHLFCGNCGAATIPTSAGHERKCTSCSQLHWPRTDPAVIMLVVDPVQDRAILGRQKIWPNGMYSTLAGFVEPGESLEDAVGRETWEEASVRVGDVRYWCSQPWPFPRSVMLGFHAVYVDGELQAHPTELDDAQWFSRTTLEAARERGFAAAQAGLPMIPPPITIARSLIDAWLDHSVTL
jgi:NAD+ diphosphatase